MYQKLCVMCDKPEELLICAYDDANGGPEARPADSTQIPSHYARLCWDGMAWTVQDCCTRFGVFRGGERLSGSVQLSMGDELHIGNTRFFCSEDGLTYSHMTRYDERLSIRLDERTNRRFLKKDVILEDIETDLFPGEMILILGGAGVDTTAFVNVVTGSEKARAEIVLAGYDVFKETEIVSERIACLNTTDHLNEEDTVWTALERAAIEQMSETTTVTARREQIDKVLTLLGIRELEDAPVTELNAAQRARLRIAVVFVAEPDVLILEEPAAGLTVDEERELLLTLRALNDEHRMTIIVSHDPEQPLDAYNRVMILACTGDGVGRLAFSGTPEEAQSFFSKQTAAEMLSVMESLDDGGEGRADEMVDKFNSDVRNVEN